MELINDLKEAIDPKYLLQTFGYVGLFLIVFAESGLFFGFFLPGDSLLLVAGVFAATGQLDLVIIIALVLAGAILGDQVGYMTGRLLGKNLFERKESVFFKKEYVTRSEEFFAKHGNKTIILARFVPIVRTFAPILAGVGKMKYFTFVTYNVVGGAIWGVGVPIAGYLLGNIPGVESYLHYIVIAIIVVSFIPAIAHIVSSRKVRSSHENK